VSTDTQASLDAFDDGDAERENEHPHERVLAESDREPMGAGSATAVDSSAGGGTLDCTCRNCGASVSAGFVRVFGVEGSVGACQHCTSQTALRHGAAAGGEHSDE